MDIKEIAELVSKKIYVEDGLLLSKFISEKFAEALIESYKAELLKGVGEPVACVDKRDWDWHLVNSPETSLGIWPTSDWKRKLNLPYQVPMFFYTSDQVAAAILKATKSLEDQLAKGNEPCAFLHEWIEYHPFGDTSAGKRCAAITSDEKPFDSSDTVSPLFTFPPTAEQIANETAEVIAEYCRNQDHYCLATEIESGAWKEFKK